MGTLRSPLRRPAAAAALGAVLTALLVSLGISPAAGGATTFTPAGLDVDMVANHVIEPGEFPGMSPAWTNQSGGTVSLTGTASNFTGPAGASYGFLTTTADYGSVGPGETVSCWEVGPDCYVLSISNPAARPAFHWDTTVTETLSTGDVKTWTLHIGRTFGDVSPTSIPYPFIETLVHNAITAGCNLAPGYYCPTFSVTREQMAIFLLRSVEGGSYAPPPVGSQTFTDVPPSSPYARWIEELVRRGITAGCDSEPRRYCPADPVTREQMAVFILRTLEGGSYNPPQPAMQRFADVPPSNIFYRFIDQLALRGITAGCSTSPPRYCPADPVTRAQMAIFLTRAFDLVLYGP